MRTLQNHIGSFYFNSMTVYDIILKTIAKLETNEE